MSVKEIAKIIDEVFTYYFDMDEPIEYYIPPAKVIHEDLEEWFSGGMEISENVHP